MDHLHNSVMSCAIVHTTAYLIGLTPFNLDLDSSSSLVPLQLVPHFIQIL
jgi:hypothetical protein